MQSVCTYLYSRRRGSLSALGWTLFVVVILVVIDWFYAQGQREDPTRKSVGHYRGNRVKGDPEQEELSNIVTQPLKKKDLTEARKKLKSMMERIRKERVEDSDSNDELAQIEIPKANNRLNTMSALGFTLPIFDAERERRLGGFKAKKSKYPRPRPKDFPVRIMEAPFQVVEDCGDILVLLMIHSSPSKEGRRRAIRKTWGTQTIDKYPGMELNRWRLIFVMGRDDHSPVNIRAENEKHGDILQGDFIDTPHEDTRKFLLGLQWVNKHLLKSCSPQFVLKSQDNIYHNMRALTNWFETTLGDLTGDLYMGNLLRMDIPVRDSQDPLYVPMRDYSAKVYPDLIKGPVYLFSIKTYMDLSSVMGQQVPIATEDAYIGILANKARVIPTHDGHFLMLGRMSNVCHYTNAFFIHDVSASEQLDIWKVVTGGHLEECKDARPLVSKGRQRQIQL